MSIRNLRRIAELAESGEPIPAPDAAWLADVVRTYEAVAPEGVTLDRVAGLVPEPGRESWWTAERRRIRDDALRALAAQFHAGLSAPRAATGIAAQLRAYESRAWLIDRKREAMPPNYAGTPKAFLFAALKSGPVPTTPRQISLILQNIFGNELGGFISGEPEHVDSSEHER